MEYLSTAIPGQDAPIRIVMDDREPCDRMLPAFASCGCFTVEVQRLSVADYFLNGLLLVERKTFIDLVQSIIDGRLFQQATKLANADYPSVLILEGSSQDLQHTEMRWEAIQGALVTITLFFGVPVLCSRDPEDTARTLMYAARQRIAVETDTLVRHGWRPKSKMALQSHILQGLPGIGPKRAKQLLARFGTVGGVIAASPEALAEVGLGPATIRKIRGAIE